MWRPGRANCGIPPPRHAATIPSELRDVRNDPRGSRTLTDQVDTDSVPNVTWALHPWAPCHWRGRPGSAAPAARLAPASRATVSTTPCSSDARLRSPTDPRGSVALSGHCERVYRRFEKCQSSAAVRRGRRGCRPASAGSDRRVRSLRCPGPGCPGRRGRRGLSRRGSGTRRASGVRRLRSGCPRPSRRFDRGCRSAAVRGDSSTHAMRGRPSPPRRAPHRRSIRAAVRIASPARSNNATHQPADQPAFGATGAPALPRWGGRQRTDRLRTGQQRRVELFQFRSACCGRGLPVPAESRGGQVGMESDQTRARIEHQMQQ